MLRNVVMSYFNGGYLEVLEDLVLQEVLVGVELLDKLCDVVVDLECRDGVAIVIPHGAHSLKRKHITSVNVTPRQLRKLTVKLQLRKYSKIKLFQLNITLSVPQKIILAFLE